MLKNILFLLEPQEAWEVNWAVGVFLGAALTIAFVLCLALIATKLRQRSRDYEGWYLLFEEFSYIWCF